METTTFPPAISLMLLIATLEGLVLGFYGTCVDELGAFFLVDEVKLGSLASLYYGAAIPGVLLALQVVSRFGMGRTLSVALVFQSLSLLLFSSSRSFPLAGALYAMVGLAYGLLINSPVGYMNYTDGEQGAKHLNWFYGAFALGLLLGPLLSGTLLLWNYGWQVPYRMVALCAVVLLLCLRMVQWRPVPLAQASLPWKDLSGAYWCLVLSFAAYSVTEAALSIWIGKFMSLVYGTKHSHYALTVFWTGMILGRFIIGFLAHRVSLKRYILLSCAVATVLLFSLGLWSTFFAATAIVGLVALVLSGVGPGFISLLGVAGSGQATALAISLATVAVAVGMPAVAYFAGLVGFRNVLGVAAIPLMVPLYVLLIPTSLKARGFDRSAATPKDS